MTVAAELAKGAQRIERFVTIEGIGWPERGIGGDLSVGFNGDIFATNDIDGTLASDLAGSVRLTVHTGLMLPSSVSEKVDPRTCKYTPSGLSFTVIDNDDFLIGAITPRKAGASALVSGYDISGATTTDVWYHDTTIYLADGTAFATGDLIWVGGRELVKLGTKTAVAGDAYYYSGSKRGYLGTQRGSSLRRPEDFCVGIWPDGQVYGYAVPWWWFDRRVALWEHVPGEAPEECSLRWYGKLRPIKNPMAGIEYRFDCVGDFISSANRIRRAIDWKCRSTKLAEARTIAGDGSANAVNWLDAAAKGYRRLLEFSPPDEVVIGSEPSGLYELAAAYQYRNVPGGIRGMVTSWDGGGVQARDVDNETDCLRSFVYVEGGVYEMLSKEPYNSNTDPKLVAAKVVTTSGESRLMASAAGQMNLVLPSGTDPTDYTIKDGSAARFLLDNLHKGTKWGRFTVWGNIRHTAHHARNPIDVALMFMLSMDAELWVGTTAAGTTGVVVKETSRNSDVQYAVGKALFLMEAGGAASELQAATISSVTEGATTDYNLDGGFDGAAGAGVEFQIRNSIYDVLPLGWGMGIPSEDVDIDSFEAVRDDYLPDVELGDFILGVQDEIDLWELLYENIFKPYGVLVYFDFETRKISARYVGTTSESETFETYTAIERENIIENGDVTHAFSNPVGEVVLTVRAVEQRIVGARQNANPPGYLNSGIYTFSLPIEFVKRQTAELMDGRTRTFRIRSDEVNIAFAEHQLDKIEINAMLNTSDESNVGPLVSRLLGIASEYSVPPPVWGGSALDVELYQSLKPGSLCLINWNDYNAPANPFTGNRGWTDIVGRVITRNYPLSGKLAFQVTIELLQANLTARLAPAVTVTGKGSDGLGEYFTVDESASAQEFVADPDNDKDFYYFAVGDEIEHRDVTGAVKASWVDRAITGFGTDERSDPTTAPGSPMRIYLDGGIGSTVAAGDYITFTSWPASVSSRRSRYSSYADANQTLGPDSDPPRVYG